MKYNIKKESDEELRYIKGLMNQSLNSFLYNGRGEDDYGKEEDDGDSDV
jgi:hypothetical protein